ncbi:DNA repair protein RAD51 homolog 2-like [Orbicella faveolata]|uniref:DNA repair protein RAD51 homolog 2-like n=1 Tax=Orbicella faveolata TaxID=48498 RepID=UPI0009E27A1D|nr:DNA repair protein RAD51 homolog 2-like [Orbicella faveolata]
MEKTEEGYLAETFHIPVVVTNQITTRFVNARSSSGSAAFQDVDGADAEPDDDDSSHVTAALGNTWSHAVNTRLIVQYMDERFRQVLISKSPVAPFASFVYTIHAQGIVLERQDPPGQGDFMRKISITFFEIVYVVCVKLLRKRFLVWLLSLFFFLHSVKI